MLTYNAGALEEHKHWDGALERDWSILRTTSLLSDESLYSNAELFDCIQDYPPVYDMPPKITPKIEPDEPITELMQLDEKHYDYDDWRNKFIDHWLPKDCLLWLVHELKDLKVSPNSLPEIKMERIAHMNGNALKDLSLESFTQMFPMFGYELFHRLQKFKSSFMYSSYFSLDQWNGPQPRSEESFYMPQQSVYAPPSQESPTLTNLDNETRPPPFSSTGNTAAPFGSISEADSGYKSDTSVETVVEQPAVPEKRRPGRPRGTRKKKKPEKLGRLWEFIRDLLLNPQYNPSMICWENFDEGMFRFVHSDRVAKLWGSKKDNVDMNYEKLSRAMRYYYKSQVLLPVYGKRLVYKFGPTSTGWRSKEPILRKC